MKHLLLAYSVLALCVGASLEAQTRDSVLVEHTSLSARSYEWRLQNPALQHSAYHSAYSTVTYRLSTRNQEKLYLQEEGLSALRHHLRASAYLPLSSRASVWGEAEYRHGQTKGVRWNSVLDPQLLSPYVVADSLGGDEQGERYLFSGGYAQSLGNWQLGGEMTFRAEQAYRTRDPRQRSIVSDLRLNMGLARRVGSYQLGISYEHNIYKQTTDVSFVDERSGIPEYMMTGLGTYNPRFSSKKGGTLYQGSGHTLDLSLTPYGSTGLYAQGLGSLYRYERISTEHNSLPLDVLYREELMTRLGYRYRASLIYDASVALGLRRSRGDENLVGSGGRGDYPVIDRLTMYYADETSAEMKLLCGKVTSWTRHMSLGASYSLRSMRYAYPHREARYKSIGFYVEGQTITPLSKQDVLSCELGLNYKKELSNYLVMPIADLEASLRSYIEYRHEAERIPTSSLTGLLRWDHHIGVSPYTLWATLGLQLEEKQALGMRSEWTLSLGLRF